MDLTVPWTDAANAAAAHKPMFPFSFDNNLPDTNIVAIRGRDTALDDAARKRYNDLPGDLIVLIEVAASGASWMAGGDIELDDLPDALTSGYDGRGFFAAFKDREVWYLDRETPLALVRRFLTIAGATEAERDILKPFLRYKRRGV
jgi:hypothetical protein